MPEPAAQAKGGSRREAWVGLAECAGMMLTACILLAAPAGCGKSGGGEGLSLNNLMKKLSGPSPSQYVAWAFDPNDADRRRQGIVGLSQKDWGLKEPYLKGYAAILRNDQDPLVRAAAARALGRARDPNYLGDVARALFDRHEMVRQDAAAALDLLHGDAAVDPLRNRAVHDENQDVRALCATALRHYRRDDAARTLVECLSDEAFSVRYRAHASLVALAGTDRGYEPQDWTEVVTKGLPPAPPKEPGNWWDRLWAKFRKPSPAPPTSTRPAKEGP